jgi:hypothetical protein
MTHGFDHGRLVRVEPLADPAREGKGDVMRTLRVFLVGIATLALTGAMGGVVLAQDVEDRPVTATHVVGTVTTGRMESSAGWSDLDEGIIAGRGAVYEHNVEWSDPRLPATMRFGENVNNYNVGGGAGVIAFVSNVRFEDPMGAWTGSEYGFAEESEAGFLPQPRVMMLRGDGAYEGLTAMLQRRYEPDDATFSHPVFEGYIFDGELPPMPDPVEPAVE